MPWRRCSRRARASAGGSAHAQGRRTTCRRIQDMSLPIDAPTIASQLRELAAYLRAENDTYRARAYERAAERVEDAPVLEKLIEAGELRRLPGIGETLERTITDL